jgi:vacuolar-type H+-ATPase subunit I/STV1
MNRMLNNLINGLLWLLMLANFILLAIAWWRKDTDLMANNALWFAATSYSVVYAFAPRKDPA